MAGMSLKEKAVLGGLGMVALYAVTVVLGMTMFRKAWTEAMDKRDNVAKNLAKEQRVISQKEKWESDYEEEVNKIRVMQDDQGSDTFWIGVIQDLATANHITIGRQKPSRETVADEMCKMTVDIEWIGALESLVRFLHDLETTDQGKFDVQSISVNPYTKNKRPGFLNGKMTLVCVFRR